MGLRIDPATTELLVALDALYPLPDDKKRAERADRTALIVKRWMLKAYKELAKEILREQIKTDMAKPKPAQWLPFKSAPLDGSRILVYGVEFGRRLTGIAYYWRGVPGDGEGWIAHAIYSEPEDDFRGVMQNPTHWMPLTAPKEGAVNE